MNASCSWVALAAHRAAPPRTGGSPRCRRPTARWGRTARSRRPGCAPARPPSCRCRSGAGRAAACSARSCGCAAPRAPDPAAAAGRGGRPARSASSSWTMPSAPVSGLLISCATPAPSSPSADSERERSSRSCACRSSAVFSSTRFSSVWFQAMISLVCCVIFLRAPSSPLGHLVERRRQVAELVAAVLGDAGLEVAGGDLLRPRGQRRHPVRQPAGEDAAPPASRRRPRPPSRTASPA